MSEGCTYKLIEVKSVIISGNNVNLNIKLINAV